jgi:large subunit ribosomal protein L17
MRHLKSGRKLNRTSSHRKSLLQNLSISLLKYKKIITTLAKAKELQRCIEKLISIGKKNNLHNKRKVLKCLKDKQLVTNLFQNIASKYIYKNGGYTKIIRYKARKGDCAHMSVIFLI